MTGHEGFTAPINATERYLTLLESSRPSKRVLAAIAMLRLEVDSHFQLQVASLDEELSSAQINELQEYFAKVADENELEPEHMHRVIELIKSDN